MDNLVTVTIESLSYHGGRGVGRFDGKVIFVPFTAPGDEVQVRITEDKGRFFEGEVVEMRTPSPSRREPPCKVFGECGGCRWQHVTYEEQLKQKEQIIKSSFRAFEKKCGAVDYKPIVGSPEEWHYRNRIQLHIENGKMGFYARKSRRVVEFDQCWIAEQALNEKYQSLEAENYDNGERLELAITTTGDLVERKSGRDPEAAYFSQVNTAQNSQLITATIEAVRKETPQFIFDLYCGTGNFTFPLQQQFPEAKITGVELSKQNLSFARALDPQQKIRWAQSDVADFLKEVKPGKPTLVVLDPPRTGCDKTVIQQLLRTKPETIAYISCNPTTLARDLSLLAESSIYQIEFVQGFDMFPQTEHVETLSLLRRR